MSEAKKVDVIETGPTLLVTSTEALRPRSALSGVGNERRANPAASVSSVSGVGAKKPCPAEMRLVHPDLRIRADKRRLKRVPFCLGMSTRAFLDPFSQDAFSSS